MSRFEEKKEKIMHILRKAQEDLTPKGFTHFADVKRNSDALLVPVQVENVSSYPIIIKRDRRHDEYVLKWRRPLAPLEYILGPGKKVILPNEYVIYYSGDGANTPVVLRKHYGSAMRD